MMSLAQEILGAKPRYEDIDGAPFKLNQRVVVSDVEEDLDYEKYIGKKGRIIYFEYDCGSGQSFPGDPMMGVELEGTNIVEEFWKNEITQIN